MRTARRAPAGGAAALWLALVAASPAAPADMLQGAWDNRAQFEAADPALHRPPAAGAPYPWLDWQHALFRRVEAPGIGGADGVVLHLVWRAGGADGPVSRQRLWVFHPAADGGWRMAFYALRDPTRLIEAAAQGPAFAALGPADVVSYPESCRLPVRMRPQGFSAEIPPGCWIVAQSGRRMALSAEIRLEGGHLSYSESGVTEAGEILFRVPGTGPYRFERAGPP